MLMEADGIRPIHVDENEMETKIKSDFDAIRAMLRFAQRRTEADFK